MPTPKIPTLDLILQLDVNSMDRAHDFMLRLGDRYVYEVNGDVRMLTMALLRIEQKRPQDIVGPNFQWDLVE